MISSTRNFGEKIHLEWGYDPIVEQDILKVYKLLDDKQANVFLQIIEKVVDFISDRTTTLETDYRFTTCLKLKNIYNKHQWFLLDARIIKINENSCPLCSIITMTNIDLVKKDDLIYYNILKKDNQGIYGTVFQGMLNECKQDSQLTLREMEIIRLISEGYKNAEIAEKLFISLNTVQTHRKNILKKTNCKGTAELTKYVFARASVL